MSSLTSRSARSRRRCVRGTSSLRRGFTLLEVLVAISILGLGLTVVLSAQTGVFWSYSRARHLSQAPGLARCKMAELELDMLKLGYPLLDEEDDGPCCQDDDIKGYSCEWQILKVKLPELPLGSDPFATGDAGAGDPGSADLGAIGALASIQQSGGAALGAEPSMGDLAQTLGGGGMMGGIGPMVMGMVYPDLKPMLEASIRKIIVSVKWQEGLNERELQVTQYVTNPQQGGLDPAAADGLEDAMDQLMGTGDPSSTSPTGGGGSPLERLLGGAQ